MEWNFIWIWVNSWWICRQFYFFFPMWMCFIHLLCINVLALTSSIVLCRRGKSGHTSLVPDFKGKCSNCSPFCTMLTMDLLHMDFIEFKYFSTIPNLLRVFIMTRCSVFQIYFSTIIEMIKCFCLSYNLLIVAKKWSQIQAQV